MVRIRLKIYILICLFTFCCTSITSQVRLDIKKKRVQEFLDYEKASGANQLKNQSALISFKPVEQPIKFKREQYIIPDLLTVYTFYSGDSLIESIKYKWEAGKNTKVADSTFIYAMISKYDSLEKNITSKLGNGEVKGGLEDVHLINQRYGLEKTVKWFSKDSIEVRLYLTLCNYTKTEETDLVKVTTKALHRIYLVVENKSKRPSVKIKSEKELRKIGTSFFYNLSNENYSKSLTYFGSGFMSKTYDIDDLELLRKKIKPENGMLFVNAVSMMVGEGNTFMFINYRSKKGIILKLIFNCETGKILAFEW